MLVMRNARVAVPTLMLTLMTLVGSAAADDKKWSFALDAPLNSKYIWRGVNLVDDWVFQPSAVMGYNGLSFLLWGNLELTGVNDYGADHGDGQFKFTEVDIAADYTFVLDRFTLGIGLIQYRFPHTSFEATTELTFAVDVHVPLSPKLAVYRDVHQVDGTYFCVTVTPFSVNLWEPSDSVQVSLDIQASVAFATGKHNAFYYGVDEFALADSAVSIAFPITFHDCWALTSRFNVSALLDRSIRESVGDPDNIWFGFGLAYTY